jgi:magnesium-protoporphyrin IX monomethyl ester (oxidative) cyclase
MARPAFHQALGIDIHEYDRRVFTITNEITKQVFPLQLDIENPKFWKGLDALHRINQAMEETRGKGLGGRLRRAWLSARAAAVFARLYALPTVPNELPDSPRLQPAW